MKANFWTDEWKSHQACIGWVRLHYKIEALNYPETYGVNVADIMEGKIVRLTWGGLMDVLKHGV